jgi:hypothetical protein
MTDPCEPQLGCATTRELLSEIDARLRTGERDEASLHLRFVMADIAAACRMGLEVMRPTVLDYRTVDS